MKRILVFLFVLLFVSLACLSITSQTIVLTATPLPTNISSTAIPASAPIAITRGCLTSKEYTNEITYLSNNYLPVMTDISTLMQEVNQDDKILSDPVWQAHVETDMTNIVQLAYRLQVLRPPRGFMNADHQLKLASVEALRLATDARAGIHNLNAAFFASATTHINNFSDYFDKATAEMKITSLDDTCP